MGKTASTLAALNRGFIDGEIRSALVVAPLRVANLTWPNEIEKWDFSKWMRVESLRGRKPSGRAQICTINYEQVDRLENLDFCDVVVMDELTKLKNPKSIRANHLLKLMHARPDIRRIGLTGTPRPNSMLEIFGQIKMLDDGKRLSPSFAHFQQTWFEAEDYHEYTWTPKDGAEEAITRKIEDLTLTLRASDYLDLPDTVVEDIEIPLPEKVREEYQTLERDLLLSMGPKGDVVAQNAAVLVNKLLQLTGGNVYNETHQPVEIHGAKIAEWKKLRKRIGKENVITFTNFIHERERLVREVPGMVDAAKFKGDIEDAWNSGKIADLVADPRSLGHGLNMQAGGRTTIWYSPNWSRELYDQANARTARKGQNEQPMVYRLVCSDTMDDVVIETLRQRGDDQSAMLALLTNLRKLRLAA